MRLTEANFISLPKDFSGHTLSKLFSTQFSFFDMPYPVRTRVIIALHNFISLVVISKVCLFVISLTPCSANTSPFGRFPFSLQSFL